LEEIIEADLLLHIIDVTSDQRHSQIEQVNQVINEIGAEGVPQIEIYNKIDLHGEMSARIEMNENNSLCRVWLSASSGEGIDGLLMAITQFIRSRVQHHRFSLPASAGKLRAHLFDMGVVRNERCDEKGGWVMEVDMESQRLDQLFRELGQQSSVESGLEDVPRQ